MWAKSDIYDCLVHKASIQPTNKLSEATVTAAMQKDIIFYSIIKYSID